MNVLPILSLIQVWHIDRKYLIESFAITHIEAKENSTVIHHNNHSIKSTKPLKYYLEYFKDKEFIQPHRSFIVNINQIEFVNHRENHLKLTSGCLIPISKRRKKEVKQFFQPTH